jgi:hypothetical protein|tara:strand:+ start:151 stop:570 length:420 start_codon:yes stop_codon:yes gene_type:complete
MKKVYLSQKPCSNTSVEHFTNLASLDNSILDSEITSLTIDSFLSCFLLSEVNEVLKIVFKKCRINCEITIIEPDCNILFRQYTRGDIELENFNQLFFDSSKKSFLNYETIQSFIPENYTIEEKSIFSFGSAMIKLRRVK